MLMCYVLKKNRQFAHNPADKYYRANTDAQGPAENASMEEFTLDAKANAREHWCVAIHAQTIVLNVHLVWNHVIIGVYTVDVRFLVGNCAYNV